jgi:methylated-DNA-[protein]-cysteine S-methyltransferase
MPTTPGRKHLAALKAYPGLPADANVEAWLVTIAHRKAIDIVRSASRRAIAVADPPEVPAPDRADGRDLDLAAPVSALPHKQRQAVAYHYLAGLPYSEIGTDREQQRCCCAPRRAAADGIATLRRMYPFTASRKTMMTAHELVDHIPVDQAHLQHLHGRLERAAQTADILDIAYRTVESAVGSLLVAATPRGLLRVAFATEGHEGVLQNLSERISPRVLQAPARLDPIARQLDEFFSGHRLYFDVALDWTLSRGFRRTVLEHLNTDVDYGATVSYANLAGISGSPKAVRAVGTACATNPIPIVVPCHRVIRKDGAIGAYRGGPAAKRVLLDLERH